MTSVWDGYSAMPIPSVHFCSICDAPQNCRTLPFIESVCCYAAFLRGFTTRWKHTSGENIPLHIQWKLQTREPRNDVRRHAEIAQILPLHHVSFQQVPPFGCSSTSISLKGVGAAQACRFVVAAGMFDEMLFDVQLCECDLLISILFGQNECILLYF